MLIIILDLPLYSAWAYSWEKLFECRLLGIFYHRRCLSSAQELFPIWNPLIVINFFCCTNELQKKTASFRSTGSLNFFKQYIPSNWLTRKFCGAGRTWLQSLRLRMTLSVLLSDFRAEKFLAPALAYWTPLLPPQTMRESGHRRHGLESRIRYSPQTNLLWNWFNNFW